MKRITSILLAICLIFGLTAGSAFASTADYSSAQQTVQALGIITGDGSGNLNLSANVTRAQFAKMMIAASAYKDTIGTSAKSSPFSDVKYTNWAASYVQTAVTAGWLTGFTDGTFRPDENVTLEQSANAVLKMLGYTSTDFAGSYPEAQIAKFTALGINAGVNSLQGQALTRQDCMYIFYNLMSTKNKTGNYYAASLGYTVNSAGKVDYSSLVLANTKGPFVVNDSSWASSLPFDSGSATIYKNGAASTLSDVQTYDVYYYNTSMKSVWIYRSRITGLYSAAAPSTTAPSSVTVAGKTYSVTDSSAIYALSNMGSFKIGDTVTLLLGMNGDVVGVTSPSNLYSSGYGVVSATSTQSYTDSTGTKKTVNSVTVAFTDGNVYQYECNNTAIKPGSIVSVNYSDGQSTINLLTQSQLSGTVNASSTALGTYAFSSDIEILDTTSNGSYLRIYPSRLTGLSLSESDIRYYVLDSTGKISKLILNDVTGDLYQVGIVTGIPRSQGGGGLTGTYTYLINGQSGTCSNSNALFPITTGPSLIEIVNGTAVNIKNLTEIDLTSVNSAYAFANGSQYTLADNLSVYIRKDGSLYLSSASELSGLTGYTLSGYYDKSASSGGRMRLIIAAAN